MNTPNKLTLLRVILVPAFVLFFYLKIPAHYLIATLVFVAAAITDAVDGHLARKNHQITDFGKFLDPLADKVLVSAAMCWFVGAGQMWAWALAAVLLREFAVSGLRLVAVDRGKVSAAAWSGKVKTAATMVCICFMLVFDASWNI